MHAQREPRSLPLAAIAEDIARSYLAGLEPEEGTRQVVRQTYPELDAHQFAQVWAMALELFRARQALETAYKAGIEALDAEFTPGGRGADRGERAGADRGFAKTPLLERQLGATPAVQAAEARSG